MTISFKGTVLITFIIAYAPTAQATEEQKDKFYEYLSQETRKANNKGAYFVIGDFNARIQTKTTEEEHECIREYTFDKENTRLRTQPAEVHESRSKLITYARKHELKIINTYFDKPQKKLITHKQLEHQGGPPYIRQHHETLDYVLAPSRWKNFIKNIESDINSSVNSDHYPLWFKIVLNLKARHHPEHKPMEFLKCDEEQNKAYNEQVTKTIADPTTHERETEKALGSILSSSAKEHIPMNLKYSKKEDLIKEAAAIIEDRKIAWAHNNREEALQLTKKLRKQVKEDRKQRLHDMISKDLDERDRWMGIKAIRKGYQPIPYTLKTEEGKRIRVGDKAAKPA